MTLYVRNCENFKNVSKCKVGREWRTEVMQTPIAWLHCAKSKVCVHWSSIWRAWHLLMANPKFWSIVIRIVALFLIISLIKNINFQKDFIPIGLSGLQGEQNFFLTSPYWNDILIAFSIDMKKTMFGVQMILNSLSTSLQLNLHWVSYQYFCI